MTLSEVRAARDSVVDVGLDPSGRYTVEGGRFAGLLDKLVANPVATLVMGIAVASVAAVIWDDYLRPTPKREPRRAGKFRVRDVAR